MRCRVCATCEFQGQRRCDVTQPLRVESVERDTNCRLFLYYLRLSSACCSARFDLVLALNRKRRGSRTLTFKNAGRRPYELNDDVTLPDTKKQRTVQSRSKSATYACKEKARNALGVVIASIEAAQCYVRMVPRMHPANRELCIYASLAAGQQADMLVC
jgi:hypothetical protein